MKKIILSLILTISMTGIATARDYNFAANTLSFYEIEQQWHNQNFFTATRAETTNVKEYFLSLAQAYPNEFFDLVVANLMGFKTDGFIHNVVVDTRNGYLSAEILTELTGIVQICHWRCSDGGTLIGVALIGDEYICDGIDYDKSYYNPDDNRTINVNDLMFFKIDPEEVLWQPKTPKEMCGHKFNFHQYSIQLPRKGKDVVLKHKSNPKENYTLQWNGTSFKAVKK